MVPRRAYGDADIARTFIPGRDRFKTRTIPNKTWTNISVVKFCRHDMLWVIYTMEATKEIYVMLGCGKLYEVGKDECENIWEYKTVLWLI